MARLGRRRQIERGGLAEGVEGCRVQGARTGMFCMRLLTTSKGLETTLAANDAQSVALNSIGSP